MAGRSSRFRVFLFCLVLLIAVFLARSLWFPWLAYPLVVDEGPAKADAVVVLAGDLDGYRIGKAATLVREGYVPLILVSGPAIYSTHEADLAINMAVKEGYPPEWFAPLRHSARSTREEAGFVLPELRRRNIHSFLLVTSNYHTARARRVFREALRGWSGGPSMRVVSADDRNFQANGWWRSREGQKILFFEWSKTIANALGL